jgi:uncharacterized protein
MLTRELAIAAYDRGRVVPDRLTRGSHAQYVTLAERMLQVYRTGIGRTRADLHRDIHYLFAHEPECPIRRIDAFCKLLDDVSVFDRDASGQAAELRRQVFHAAAPFHPLVSQTDRLFETTELDAKTRIAEQLGRPWAQIEAELFADIIEFHRLKTFDGYPDPVALLSRYNVAQVQIALFDAVSLTVWASDDLKTILRYAKLARLMHTIRRSTNRRAGGVSPLMGGDTATAANAAIRGLTPPACLEACAADVYELTFDGPASVLRETRRYGVAMAKFLPALLACRGWRLHAVIQSPRAGWQVALDLSPEDQLKSHLPAPEEFDSDIESEFARKWGGEPRDGWSLAREADILHSDQRVFVPDFTFRHTDGRQVLLEIVGFWTEDYLTAKLRTLRLFSSTPILLAVAERLTDQLPPLPPSSIVYKTVLKVSDVLARLTRGADSDCHR